MVEAAPDFGDTAKLLRVRSWRIQGDFIGSRVGGDGFRGLVRSATAFALPAVIAALALFRREALARGLALVLGSFIGR